MPLHKINWKNNCILAAIFVGVLSLVFLVNSYDIKSGKRAANALSELNHSEKLFKRQTATFCQKHSNPVLGEHTFSYKARLFCKDVSKDPHT